MTPNVSFPLRWLDAQAGHLCLLQSAFVNDISIGAHINLDSVYVPSWNASCITRGSECVT